MLVSFGRHIFLFVECPTTINVFMMLNVYNVFYVVNIIVFRRIFMVFKKEILSLYLEIFTSFADSHNYPISNINH
jgi:hypothetical protein